MADEESERAEKAAKRRLRGRAKAYYATLEEAFLNALPGNQSPAETVFIAHLMTAVDGYNDVRLAQEWRHKPRSGWQTTMVYLPDLENGLTATFGFECRHDDHSRQLAVLVDGHRPGERLPEKMERERRLTSLNFRVMSFTEMEILADPDECRERVESVLADMTDEVLVDAGVIQGHVE